MTLTRALVEILLSPYPESQSTTSIFDVADKATGNAPDTDSPMVGIGGGVPLASPLYLLASEIVDLVELERKRI